MMASEEKKQKHSMAKALLKQRLVQAPEPEDRDGEAKSTSPVKMIGFMFLTFNSGMALSSWHRGFGAVCFLAFSCLDLALLFHCLRLYARTPPGSPRREMLKMAAWLLATMLTVTFFQLLELMFLTVGKAEIPITDFQKPHRLA